MNRGILKNGLMSLRLQTGVEGIFYSCNVSYTDLRCKMFSESVSDSCGLALGTKKEPEEAQKENIRLAFVRWRV